MKRYIALLLLASITWMGTAQNFDTQPILKIEKESLNIRLKAGARFMGDVGYFHSQFTPIKSGANLTDARIRASFSYYNWEFYTDFGFGGGKFAQKNIFVQWSTSDTTLWGRHVIKGGYFNDPASMARNTSSGSYHFITRPSMAMALQEGRELGITYKFYNRFFFANQGVFAEKKYNDQAVGSQGVTVSGRWLYRPINNENHALHIGLQARFGMIGTGTMYNDNVMQTMISLGTPFETYINEDVQLVHAEIPWAKYVTNVGAELFYSNASLFARGEFIYKYITKERDSRSLFESNLGSIDSWGTYESWLKGNPLGPNSFMGGYIEFGYRFLGEKGYEYNNSEGTLGGVPAKSLELVARYSYTGLNDIEEGELYELGRDQYYPGDKPADWPATQLSIGGGNLHSATIGLNYAFNDYMLLMVNYGFHILDRDKYPMDKMFHAVQARVQFAF